MADLIKCLKKNDNGPIEGYKYTTLNLLTRARLHNTTNNSLNQFIKNCEHKLCIVIDRKIHDET